MPARRSCGRERNGFDRTQMAKLYRELVLKEQAAPELVQIGLGASPTASETAGEAMRGSGD
jgi:hypothetical protein